MKKEVDIVKDQIKFNKSVVRVTINFLFENSKKG